MAVDKITIREGDGTYLGKNIMASFGVDADYIIVDIIKQETGENATVEIDPSNDLKKTWYFPEEFTEEQGVGEYYYPDVYIYYFSKVTVTDNDSGVNSSVMLQIKGYGNLTFQSSGVYYNSVLYYVPFVTYEFPKMVERNSQYFLVDKSVDKLSFFFFPPENNTNHVSVLIMGTQILTPDNGDPSVRGDVKLLTFDVYRPGVGELEAEKTYFKNQSVDVTFSGICKIEAGLTQSGGVPLLYTLIYA